MKCVVPEISWHNRDPVYTVDIQPKINPNESFYRLASGGADSHVVIWYVTPTKESKTEIIEFAADLERHLKAVNVVRFSPNGELLASGDDGADIIIWRMRKENDLPDFPSADEDKEKEKESWVSLKVLRGHLEDVYDLSWSPDSTLIISGSVDNTAVLWDVNKGKSLGVIGEHKGFVQGVAWDPKNKYWATMCTDRTLRVFNIQTRKAIARVSKAKYLNGKTVEDDKEDKLTKLFYDDTLKTFFRRLCFTPDGELLITPCGLMEDPTTEGKSINATYIFIRNDLNQPVLHLPSPGQYTVAVRCCPTLFELRPDAENLFCLSYRIVFAVATKSTVVFYDTQQSQPFAFVSNIHYTGLTDITWAADGRLLLVSSSEGYCSVITFDENELGKPYIPLNEPVSSPEKSENGNIDANTL